MRRCASARRSVQGGRAAAHAPWRCTCRGNSARARPRSPSGQRSGLGVAGTIRSPSYSLLEVYQTAAGTVVHADFYRLRGSEELEDLVCAITAWTGVLQVIEWPENAGAGGSPPALACASSLRSRGRGRHATWAGASPAEVRRREAWITAASASI